MGDTGQWRHGGLIRLVLGLALAAMVSYFTAESAIRIDIARVEEREEAHYKELQRSVDRIERNVEYLLRRNIVEHQR